MILNFKGEKEMELFFVEKIEKDRVIKDKQNVSSEEFYEELEYYEEFIAV